MQRGCVGLVPFEFGAPGREDGLGRRDHVGRDVNAGNRSRRSHTLGGGAGDDAGAAGDVEHPLAGLEVRGTEGLGRHRDGDGRHEEALVQLSGRAGVVAVGGGGHLTSFRSRPDHWCVGGVTGAQLVVPSAVAVGGDSVDAAAAHLAEVQAASDDIAVRRVLGLDVLGDEAGAGRDRPDDLQVDGSFSDRAQLGAERVARTFELKSPQRGEQVEERVRCEQVVAGFEVAEAAMELRGERLDGGGVDGWG